MPGPDASGSAALSAPVSHPCYVGWLDFDGDPLRLTTAPYDVTFSGTGDAELDGFTFEAADPRLINISDVHHREDGSETVTASMSGLPVIDAPLLNIIGDPSKWRGRAAALWLMLYDSNLQRVGNVWRFYTGVMSSAPIRPAPDNQTIEIQIESYLASLTQASNRTYLDQKQFDPGDLSADAAIAIANGTSGAGLAGTGGGMSGGAGSGFRLGGGLFEDAILR
ncbi:hypothetical protein K4H03_20700 [Mycobacterium tuberculosis]|nr:hypothetical protein [Mycobacterium tuberculosis]